jgi:predicted Rossmann-fold nucleotide-binding protein
MVLTGAGGGIMQAGNEDAGRENSFGLNIQLPFEQGANPYIINDAKLIDFKYFFTRKLFFLRESDAVALFPRRASREKINPRPEFPDSILNP